uniref:Uncharacterized protein n=1 Tax=Amphimedon queenslandica TaxID=400682 RepID=A0A1X7TIE4_AMPQE
MWSAFGRSSKPKTNRDSQRSQRDKEYEHRYDEPGYGVGGVQDGGGGGSRNRGRPLRENPVLNTKRGDQKDYCYYKDEGYSKYSEQGYYNKSPVSEEKIQRRPPRRQPQQQEFDPDAEMERAMKEMEAKYKADLAKMQAEKDEFLRKVSEDSETELKKSREDSARRLGLIKNQHEQEVREKELIEKQKAEEFQVWKQKSKLATEEIEAMEKSQKELLSWKRHEIEEEDRRLQSELEEKLEDQAILNAMNYDDKKIQMYMEMEENRKKAEEDVKSYRKAAREKTHEDVLKIKKDFQDSLYRK